MQKLTLSMDPEVIDMAKQLAKQRGISASEMISRIIRVMADPERPARIGPLTRQATGMFKLPEGKSVEELIEEAKAERAARYLR
ncbi:MAG: ribbon-helix-helix domain-containing protein [Phycisphaerae bacterium]|nr:ribbon-helix-helix domain-containing protein [Phycisphaerae bacterium]